MKIISGVLLVLLLAVGFAAVRYSILWHLETQKTSVLSRIVGEIPTPLLRDAAARHGNPIADDMRVDLRSDDGRQPTEAYGSSGHVIFIFGEAESGGIEIRKLEFK